MTVSVRRRRVRHRPSRLIPAGLCLVLATVSLACTSIRVTDVDPAQHRMERVCIVENPEVTVDGFLSIVQQEFLRHGIRTNAYSGSTMPTDCEYHMQYSARRGWDMVTYLKFAELRITRQGELVGAATYRHAGGFGLNKYASTEKKLRRLIDRLLVKYPNSSRDPL
jgi:hypothetical protein